MLLLMKIKIVWARAHPVMFAWTHFLCHRPLLEFGGDIFLEFGEFILVNSIYLLYPVEPLICGQASISFGKPSNMKPSPHFVASVSYSIPHSYSQCVLYCFCPVSLVIRVSKTTKPEEVMGVQINSSEDAIKSMWGERDETDILGPLFLNSPKGWGISWLGFSDMRWREGTSGLQGSALFLMNSFGVQPPGMEQDLVSFHGLYKLDASKLKNLSYTSRGRAKERERNAQATNKRCGEETSEDAKQRLEVNPSPKTPDFFPNATCPQLSLKRPHLLDDAKKLNLFLFFKAGEECCYPGPGYPTPLDAMRGKKWWASPFLESRAGKWMLSPGRSAEMRWGLTFHSIKPPPLKHGMWNKFNKVVQPFGVVLPLWYQDPWPMIQFIAQVNPVINFNRMGKCKSSKL